MSRSARGVTLIEMMVVMTIIAVMGGVLYPSAASGLESMRLSATTDEVASFLNGAMERANRRQIVVAVTVDRQTNTLIAHSTEANFIRRYELPASVTIQGVLPLPPGIQAKDMPPQRTILFYPGGNVPRIGIALLSRNGGRRIVRIDPITGTPQIEKPV
jgi:prepilin-type N-terminal cleavage/methylation domain-containing protein